MVLGTKTGQPFGDFRGASDVMTIFAPSTRRALAIVCDRSLDHAEVPFLHTFSFWVEARWVSDLCMVSVRRESGWYPILVFR